MEKKRHLILDDGEWHIAIRRGQSLFIGEKVTPRKGDWWQAPHDALGYGGPRGTWTADQAAARRAAPSLPEGLKLSLPHGLDDDIFTVVPAYYPCEKCPYADGEPPCAQCVREGWPELE